MRAALALALVQFLARAPLVDPHHRDADRPCRFADAEAEVAVVGVDVAALLRGVDDLDDGGEDAVGEVGCGGGVVVVVWWGGAGAGGFEAAEERAHVG